MLALHLAVGAQATGLQRVRIVPYYLRSDQSAVGLDSTEFSLASGDTHDLTLEVDIAPCIRDTLRERVPLCPLRIALVLLSDQGDAVDSQSIGPFDADATAPLTTPPVQLRRISALTVTVGADTVLLGESTTVSAIVLDGTGVARSDVTVEWRSANTSVATVSPAGVVTAVGGGSTTIDAIVREDSSQRASVNLAVRDAASCTSPGTAITQTTLSGPETWTRRMSPLYVGSDVLINGTLTVSAGARVCLADGASLRFRNGGRLEARGTASEPIVFAATSPQQRWEGLEFSDAPPDSSYLTNVILEWGGKSGAIVQPSVASLTFRHPVVYDSVRIRQWRGTAVLVAAGRLSRSVVDTVSDLAPAGSAVVLGPGATFEASTVRASSGDGVMVAGSDVIIRGGLITSSAQVGLNALSQADLRGPSLPPRIVGNAYPARLTPVFFGRLKLDSLDQAQWLGNQRDTLVVIGGLLNMVTVKRDTLTAYGHLPWRNITTIHFDTGAVLRMRSGARVAMSLHDGLTFAGGGRLDAQGSVGAPVTFTAANPAQRWDFLFFVEPAPDSSFIRNAVIEHAGSLNGWAIWLHDGRHTLVVDSSHLRNLGKGALLVQGAGTVTSQISRTRIENLVMDTTGVGLTHPGIVGANPIRLRNVEVRNARGDGLLSTAQVELDAVTITGSYRHGINVTLNPQFLVLSRVNLIDNGGFGINNADPTAVNASGLWWGDPAGPNGGSGDGVGGLVNWAPAAVSPFNIGLPSPGAGGAPAGNGTSPVVAGTHGLRVPMFDARSSLLSLARPRSPGGVSGVGVRSAMAAR